MLQRSNGTFSCEVHSFPRSDGVIPPGPFLREEVLFAFYVLFVVIGVTHRPSWTTDAASVRVKLH